MNTQHQSSNADHVCRPRHRHQRDSGNVMYDHFNEILHNSTAQLQKWRIDVKTESPDDAKAITLYDAA